MVYLTVSTGIGGGICAGGRLLEGAHGFAGELGHVTVDPDGPPCPCGGRGCVQLYASGSSIARRARELAAKAGPGGFLAGKKEVTAYDVECGVRAGDRLCAGVWDAAMCKLGIAVGILNQVLDPDLFVFGGGVSNAWDLMEGPVLASARRYCYTDTAHHIRLARAQLGGLVGTTGAILLARDLL